MKSSIYDYRNLSSLSAVLKDGKVVFTVSYDDVGESMSCGSNNPQELEKFLTSIRELIVELENQ